MNYNKMTIEDIDVDKKRVLVRCDFNVPQDENGNITDDNRIVESLPTIIYLLKHQARIILCSHLGRPKGEFKKKYSLAPVAKRLGELLSMEIIMASDVIGDDAKSKAANLSEGQVMLLENVRFHAEEEKNDAAFSSELASMAELYVNDAFGTSHRAHASTAGVASYLPAVCGFLIEKELKIMGGALDNPKRPFVAILGGSKVSDKLGVINNLLEKVDVLIIGGGMSFTFTKALGGSIGKSICEDDKLDYARDMIEKAKKKGIALLLPQDTVTADKFAADANTAVYDAKCIPDELMGLDIGPKTVETLKKTIADAKTVVWNGPMGVFEFDAFAVGTREVASAIAASSAVSIIGGGDSAAAVQQMGFASKITHISTGGGASLEFLEGLELPGIACLKDKIN